MANNSGILNFYNGFGITPTNNFVSAGTDYYIPNINSSDEEIVARVEDAFFLDPKNPKKPHSFDCTKEQAEEIKIMFTEALTTVFDSIKATDILNSHWHNILHLYLALQSIDIEKIREDNGNVNEYFIEDVYYFIENYLTFDNKGVPGLIVNTLDHLFINSGIKVALNSNDAGLYVNKSGMGKKGWDVRAQLVDEDYSGYVHLSCAYTMCTNKTKARTIYCGDKITQMMIVEVKHYELNSVSADEYDKLMENSQRGATGFGNSDVKH